MKYKVVLIILINLFFIRYVFSQKNKLVAYSWCDYSNGKLNDRIVLACRVGMQPKMVRGIGGTFTYSVKNDLNDIADALKRMPQGHRVIQVWLAKPYIDLLVNNKKDRLEDPNSQNIIDQNLKMNIFWVNGADYIGEIFSDFFKNLRNKGAIVDYVMLDIENPVSNWAVSNAMRANAKQNFKPLPSKESTFNIILSESKRIDKNSYALLDNITGKKILQTQSDYNNSYIKFNSYFRQKFCGYLNTAFYIPAKKYFPEVKCSNYGDFYQNVRFKVPENNGHNNYLGGKGKIVGTDQAPSLYGYLGSSIKNYIPNSRNLNLTEQKNTAFDALQYDINLLKSITIDFNTPVSPYLACRSFGSKSYLLGGNDYYQENLFHVLLSGCKNILFWNASNGSNLKDEILFYNCLRRVDSVLGNVNLDKRQAIIDDSDISWENNYVLSKMVTAKLEVWRFTPNWNYMGGRMPLNKEDLKEKINKMIFSLNPLTLKVGSKRIVFPKGSKLYIPKNSLSNAGIWIIKIK